MKRRDSDSRSTYRQSRSPSFSASQYHGRDPHEDDRGRDTTRLSYLSSSDLHEKKIENDHKEEEEELPLVDEINDLLLKERTLLGLKVVEQQIEAEEWKRKYEKLVNKLTENVTDLEIFEMVSEVDQMKLNTLGPNHNFDYYLQYHAQNAAMASSSPSPCVGLETSWCLNLSKMNISRMELKKLLNYPKSHGDDKIRILDLSRCEIQDKDADLVMLLFHYPRLEALDLSYNDLSTEFHASFMQSIERRRLQLQYLNLEGNMPLSILSMERLVHHLSSQTWGLKMSLNDLENLTRSEIRAQQGEKNSKSKSMKQTGVPDLSLPPNPSYTVRLCTKFLRHLNFVLGPNGETDVKKSSSKTRSTESKTQTSKPLEKVKNELKDGFQDVVKKHLHRGPDKGEGGLQCLCVFGLTHAKFCKESFVQLRETLELSSWSLTDLDLTYAFMGIAGAEIIADALEHRYCQLIRLGLTGNSLGDHGVDIMSSSIENTSTLTYLDIRSNDISNRGLSSLTHAVMRHQILRFLVIDGNPFHPGHAIECQRRIELSGSQTQLRWSSALGLLLDSSPRKEPVNSSTLFTISSQMTVTIDPITRSCKLYTIPSHHFRPLSKQFRGNSLHEVNESDPSSEYVVIKWVMGVSTQNSEEKDLYAKLCKTRLSWEIKCITGSKVVTFAKNILQPNACLPVGQRVECAATIPCPPMYSNLEIWAYVTSADVRIGSRIHSTTMSKNKSLNYEVEGGLHLDCCHLQITRPNIYHNPENFIKISADIPEISVVENSIMSLYDPYENQSFYKYHHIPPNYHNLSLPDGYTIIRHLRWTGQAASHGQIQFQLKLSASHGLKKENSLLEAVDRIGENKAKIVHEPSWNQTEDIKPNLDHQLGYHWIVMRCRHDGIGSYLLDNWYEVIGEGTHLDNTENMTNHPIETSLLDPWLWRSYCINVENILLNDGYILLYKVSTPTIATSIPLKNSNTLVIAKDWGISLIGESFYGVEERLDSSFQGNILNGIWNDPSLQIAL